jgi:hypothetical protein
MVAVPAATPLSTPDAEPMEATDELLLLHTPPVTTSLNVTEPLTQTNALPEITPGGGLTETVAVPGQPDTGI